MAKSTPKKNSRLNRSKSCQKEKQTLKRTMKISSRHGEIEMGTKMCWKIECLVGEDWIVLTQVKTKEEAKKIADFMEKGAPFQGMVKVKKAET
jgi:hypothetical protein